MSAGCSVAVVGSDTGVGKTRVAGLLVAGLRRLGRKVWVHKPIACGDWSCGMADDGRTWAGLVADGQPPATVCPFQFPEPASPHVAAAAAGRPVAMAELRAALAAVRGDHDLVVEGAGGLLTPLSQERGTIADLLAGTGIPLLLVTRPDLGTLNHTALTVECARRRGLPLLGLVLNRARPVVAGLATDQAARELVAITGLPLLADLAHSVSDVAAGPLAAAVLERHHPPRP
jgi:dethiobiotin synthetase